MSASLVTAVFDMLLLYPPLGPANDSETHLLEHGGGFMCVWVRARARPADSRSFSYGGQNLLSWQKLGRELAQHFPPCYISIPGLWAACRGKEGSGFPSQCLVWSACLPHHWDQKLRANFARYVIPKRCDIGHYSVFKLQDQYPVQ